MQVDEAESAVATIVVLSMTRDLRLVLAGLMVMGSVGASMAAELWTMPVTEQIDALQTPSTGPYKNLFWPRMMADNVHPRRCIWRGRVCARFRRHETANLRTMAIKECRNFRDYFWFVK